MTFVRSTMSIILSNIHTYKTIHTYNNKKIKIYSFRILYQMQLYLLTIFDDVSKKFDIKDKVKTPCNTNYIEHFL